MTSDLGFAVSSKWPPPDLLESYDMLFLLLKTNSTLNDPMQRDLSEYKELYHYGRSYVQTSSQQRRFIIAYCMLKKEGIQ